MKDNKTIPIESIEERLAEFGYNWHATDYFISPDENDNPDKGYSLYKPDYYILGLCIKGWIVFEVDGKPLTIRPNYFFAANPQMSIQKVNQSAECKLRYLFFTKDFLLNNITNFYELESFLFYSGNAEPYLELEKADAEPLLQLFDILQKKREKVNTPHHLEIIRSLFYTFLYEAAAIYQKRQIKQPKFTRDAELNLKFQELLAKNDNKKHKLKFYADSLFITPKYLIHAIKKSSGKTPGKLIDEAIVAEAKLLLKDPEQTVAAVSEQLQFSDQASFSKFFKKNTGITPYSYRSRR